MDQVLSPGGFLGGFLLLGILLPITLSFVADGIVFYFRGRGPTRLVLSVVTAVAIIALYSLAWQNALDAGEVEQMLGAIGLILCFSIPASALGFGVRMVAIFLNPTTKLLDREAIEERAARHAEHVAARRAALTRHA
ncbi:MAG TPA: hypothetical protein VHX87_13545 [Galbitalea sp.]|jgi:hypothetical protein|nr:hypothetical protein [Galbitalea sp.]